MGAKYTTQATAGYDSSPPADDGSQVAANLITWSGIKTKLANVLKTFGEAINTSLVSAFDYSVRQTSVSDTTVASDHMRCVEIASTVTTAVTIALGDAATMTNVYRVFVKNSSARNQTVARVTGADTIDGVAANVTLPPGAGAIFQTINAATGYVINGWYGPFSDGSTVVAGGTDGTKKLRIEVDGLTTATTRVATMPDYDLTLGQVGVKTVTFTRDTSLASGAQAVTGVGFTPRVVIFLSGLVTGTAQISMGMDDGTTPSCLYNNQNSSVNTWGLGITFSIEFIQSGTADYQGKITSFGADGFTVTWTKTGVTSGTNTIAALCFR